MLEKLEQEAVSVLMKLAPAQTAFPEINWFLNCVYRRFSKKHLLRVAPSLIVLGEDVPRELALALDPAAFFVLGGSLDTCRWSDALLPRDAEPVSRSACGWLLNPTMNLTEDALVVTTLCSDNRRKLVGLLRERGVRVAAADLPPLSNTQDAEEIWLESMSRLIEAMEKHTGRCLSFSLLARTIKESQRVRKSLLDFHQALLEKPGCLAAALTRIIEESVWYAEDREEWTRRLNLLTEKILALTPGGYLSLGTSPWVLLTGSPVVFPNEKLPLLLEESGLYVADWVDAVSIQPQIDPGTPPHFGTVSGLLRQLMASRLSRNISGAFAVNTGYLDTVRWHLETVPVDGIVYHVLKGHIEADFELPRIEKLAEEYGLPLIRVETDYQQQDVEQLRIRMEAFSEMLRQQRQEEVGIAQ